MKVMVVGGAGYIGSLLVPALARRGHEVAVVDTMWFAEAPAAAQQVRSMDAFDLCEEDLRGFDALIFLAGLSNDPMADFSPRLNFQMNGALPAYLGYIARRAGVAKFVMASTCSVYGYSPSELSVEDGQTRTTTPYGLSKLAAERSLLNMASDEFSVIALRKGTVSGFAPRMRLDLVLNTMFKTALSTGRVFVSNPAVWRPLLGIHDAVRAYTRALEAPQEVSGAFNVASGNYMLGHLGEVVRDFVAEDMGRACELAIGDVAEIRSYKVDWTRAQIQLGYEAMESPSSVLQDLARNLDSFSDFDSDRLYNIRVFEKLGLK